MKPIDYTNWFKRDSWTIVQAAYLCHGIEPNDTDTIESLDSFTSRYKATNPYENAPTPVILISINDVKQILDSVKWEESNSAIPTASLMEIIQQKELDTTGVLISEWSKFTDKQNPQASKPDKTDCSNDTGNNSHFGPDIIAAFDPLPISTCAKVFSSACRYSEAEWKDFANRAKRNGLDKARIDKRGGSGKSTFNPALVADWLINEGEAKPEHLRRILKNNLPDRSKDREEDLFGI